MRVARVRERAPSKEGRKPLAETREEKQKEGEGKARTLSASLRQCAGPGADGGAKVACLGTMRKGNIFRGPVLPHWRQRQSGALVMGMALAFTLHTSSCFTAPAVSVSAPVAGSPHSLLQPSQRGSKGEQAWRASGDHEDSSHDDLKEHCGQVDELISHMSEFQAWASPFSDPFPICSRIRLFCRVEKRLETIDAVPVHEKAGKVCNAGRRIGEAYSRK